MNSAESWIDILSFEKGEVLEDERIITWLSESGKMEFFIFGASTQNGGPKRVQKLLADITGFAPLPPYFSLGFHYSKWEPISTELMINKLQDFNDNMMPVDVFWLDIEYTD
jgi:alpha 1,3-glucosidase